MRASLLRMNESPLASHQSSRSIERLADWLLGSRVELPASISRQLRNGLFTSVPIFLGGVLNTIFVAAIGVVLFPEALFFGWLVFEIVLGIARVATLAGGRNRLAQGEDPPWLASALLSCAWAASVGFGTVVALLGGHWLFSIIVLLSASAMVCGIVLRNYGTPRLAALMTFLILAPCAIAGVLTGEPLLAVISLQLPIYMVTIFAAAFALHNLMVTRMTALNELQVSETLNETILSSSPDYTLILDEDYRIVFCNRPNSSGEGIDFLGLSWLTLLPPEDRDVAVAALQRAANGKQGNLVTHSSARTGDRRWFDVIANRVSDDSGRLLVVARDITHQKRSEERALWMARHDSLTRLPNRALLQDRLDSMLADFRLQHTGALLILDIDNFKVINDTLGHDAGDALLCTFGNRLRAALDDGDLVARTGGDEFAVIVSATSDEQVHAVAERIFDHLREPFYYEGRLLECCASIGASLIPRDGSNRSEILKAADIALYAAKSSGRAQLKLFEQSMLLEVEDHQAMIASARRALQSDAIVPHYQPKVSLRDGTVVGFEALLRWRDHDGRLQGPDVLLAAFDDPALSAPLSDRMLKCVLADLRNWLDEGLQFGHVAINVTAADFRRGSFADRLLDRLAEADVPPSCIQIEVTETVFLGRGAGYVEEALKQLSIAGVRIALDDFGTGYASLSHLNQFPVDLLKIDRSFIGEIGCNADSEAIATTVVNLGHCLGLEVIAEGIETRAQEAYLARVGCDTGQGFLYAEAVPGAEVPAMLLEKAPARRA